MYRRRRRLGAGIILLRGIAALCLETLYPLAFFRKLRPFLICGLISMHLGTIVSQGLTLFGLTMISLNVFFWLESREWESRRNLAGTQAAQATT